MKKKINLYLVLLLLAIVGSFIGFYSINLFMSDLANMFYGVHDANIISSFPLFFVFLNFVFATIFVYRLILRPQYKRSMIKLYCTFIWITSFLGMVSSILTSALIYGSFFVPYPFPFYSVIIFMVHIIGLFVSIIVYKENDSLMTKEDQKRKLSVQYCVWSGILVFLIILAYNRFGAFLWSPSFLHLRTFYLTWPFYLSLLVPIAQLLGVVLYTLPAFRQHSTRGFIYSTIMLVLAVVLNGATVLIGYFNTSFVAAISPTLPLERLASKPYDTILITVVSILFAVYEFNYSLIYKKRHPDTK